MSSLVEPIPPDQGRKSLPKEPTSTQKPVQHSSFDLDFASSCIDTPNHSLGPISSNPINNQTVDDLTNNMSDTGKLTVNASSNIQKTAQIAEDEIAEDSYANDTQQQQQPNLAASSLMFSSPNATNSSTTKSSIQIMLPQSVPLINDVVEAIAKEEDKIQPFFPLTSNCSRSTVEFLQLYANAPPSLTIHLFQSHFYFDQQDSVFHFDGPMRCILESLRNETIHSDMIEVFQAAKVPVYEGRLIVEIKDHRPDPQKLKSITARHSFKDRPHFGFLNRKSISEKTNAPATTNTAANTSTVNDENDTSNVSHASGDGSNDTNATNHTDYKTYRTVLKPSAECLWQDLCLQSESLMGRVSDLMALQLEAKLLVATEPPPFLTPASNLAESMQILNSIKDDTPECKIKKRRIYVDETPDEDQKKEYERLMHFMDDRYGKQFQSSFSKLAIIEQLRKKLQAQQGKILQKQMQRQQILHQKLQGGQQPQQLLPKHQQPQPQPHHQPPPPPSQQQQQQSQFIQSQPPLPPLPPQQQQQQHQQYIQPQQPMHYQPQIPPDQNIPLRSHQAQSHMMQQSPNITNRKPSTAAMIGQPGHPTARMPAAQRQQMSPVNQTLQSPVYYPITVNSTEKHHPIPQQVPYPHNPQQQQSPPSQQQQIMPHQMNVNMTPMQQSYLSQQQQAAMMQQRRVSVIGNAAAMSQQMKNYPDKMPDNGFIQSPTMPIQQSPVMPNQTPIMTNQTQIMPNPSSMQRKSNAQQNSLSFLQYQKRLQQMQMQQSPPQSQHNSPQQMQAKPQIHPKAQHPLTQMPQQMQQQTHMMPVQMAQSPRPPYMMSPSMPAQNLQQQQQPQVPQQQPHMTMDYMQQRPQQQVTGTPEQISPALMAKTKEQAVYLYQYVAVLKQRGFSPQQVTEMVTKLAREKGINISLLNMFNRTQQQQAQQQQQQQSPQQQQQRQQYMMAAHQQQQSAVRPVMNTSPPTSSPTQQQQHALMMKSHPNYQPHLLDDLQHM